MGQGNNGDQVAILVGCQGDQEDRSQFEARAGGSRKTRWKFYSEAKRTRKESRSFSGVPERPGRRPALLARGYGDQVAILAGCQGDQGLKSATTSTSMVHLFIIFRKHTRI